MLELRQVSKAFGDLQVLQPTTLSVPEGQTLALLGPSGCGKSTLLRMVVGLVAPDTGEICLGGEPVSAASMQSLRLRLGYMIQEGGLFPHLSIRDNVTLVARYLRWEPSRIGARLGELAELTHLPEGSLDRFPSQVSGGQRQRVALMRALFLDPDLLLLDEPMGALDPLIRSDLQAELKQIFARLKKTVVLVTHDIGEAGFLADEIALLERGCILQRGSLSDLVRHPAAPFVSEFINAQRSPLEALGELP